MNPNPPRLLIAPIEEEEALQGRVTPEDLLRANSFGSPRRRAEYLSWRAALYGLLQKRCSPLYNAMGAPLLPEGWGWIGVSHGRELVALIHSPHRPVAIDIESSDRPYRSLSPRFLTPNEEALSQEALWPGIAWSAKEVLYKISGCEGLDFRRDLHLDRLSWPTTSCSKFDPLSPKNEITPEGVIEGRVKDCPHLLGFSLFEGGWVVWTL